MRRRQVNIRSERACGYQYSILPFAFVSKAQSPLGLKRAMSRFLNVLRSWLVMVSIIAMGNTLQSFRDHTFLYEKLYTGKPDLGEKIETCIPWGSGGVA